MNRASLDFGVLTLLSHQLNELCIYIRTNVPLCRYNRKKINSKDCFLLKIKKCVSMPMITIVTCFSLCSCYKWYTVGMNDAVQNRTDQSSFIRCKIMNHLEKGEPNYGNLII